MFYLCRSQVLLNKSFPINHCSLLLIKELKINKQNKHKVITFLYKYNSVSRKHSFMPHPTLLLRDASLKRHLVLYPSLFLWHCGVRGLKLHLYQHLFRLILPDGFIHPIIINCQERIGLLCKSINMTENRGRGLYYIVKFANKM